MHRAPHRCLPWLGGFRSLVLAGALLAATPCLAADFYAERLREGSLAFERGDAVRAVKELRIACFGLLDNTALLGECLTRLALAEDKLGAAENFREAFRRLAEVEERFSGYTQAALPAETRAQFERRAAVVIPPSVLQQSPPALRLAAARRAPPEGVAVAPGGQAAPATPGRSRPAPQPTAAPPPAAPPPAAAVQPRSPVLSAQERGQLDQVRNILSQPAESRALSSAFELARGVADAHPTSVEAQHLAAEAAYRIKRFKEAADYFQRGGDPGDTAAELLFYQAVSLFELGNREAAASALRRALPNLRRTPYVDGYAKKVLGQ